MSTVASIEPVRLRCEFHRAPLAVEETAPRLSWELKPIGAGRGKRQTAYRILVASAPESLDRDEGDLWDSGKVESAESCHIRYGGKPLTSRLHCFWKVRVWDEQDRPSAWSEPAEWRMGLLTQSDWQAQWIEWDTVDEEARFLPRFDGLAWTGLRTSPDVGDKAGAALRYTFQLPSSRKVRRAVALITATGPFRLLVNGVETPVRSEHEQPWTDPEWHEVTDFFQPGENPLVIEITPRPGDPAAALGRFRFEFDRGAPLDLPIDGSWKAVAGTLDRPDGEERAPLNFGHTGTPPWCVPGGGKCLLLPPARYLRKEFEASGKPRRAVLYVSALGVCDVYINGTRVSDDVFTPGWTDYRKRVPYRAYDVTDLVRSGVSVLGAVLADGWYAGHVAWGNIRERYGAVPKFLAQLEIETDDAGVQVVTTDGTWKAQTAPMLEADHLMGETYDARREEPGWCEPGYSDADWANVVVRPLTHGPVLTAHAAPPVRPTQELPVQTVTSPADGVYVFDLGQNMVGWVRLRVSGPRGHRVTLRFGEVLNPDGTVYTENLRGARATDTYILRGEGVEVWAPRFTFHGFRYVELTGWPSQEPPPPDAITGVVLHTDLPLTGEFECSDPMVNRLFQNVVWGQRGNYLEVPTDCPQRDERLGWTGDAQAFIPAGSYIMDVESFFKKWLVDLEDGQNAEGAYPHVAPDVGLGFDSPAWGDAAVICPWVLYRMYGDLGSAERHYPAMQRYIEYLEKHTDGLLRPAIGFGDWLSIQADTPKDLIATAYFAWVVHLMAELARALGRADDAERYDDLFDRIRDAFNRKYVLDDGRTTADTQTSYVLALGMGLLPEEHRAAAVRRLAEDIEQRGRHLSTGFLGTSLIMPLLSSVGLTDVAYRLLHQDTCPSWMYQIRRGATTIWERWDGIREDGTFQTPTMNSYNHYAFGAVAQWLFGYVAGIRPLEPGFRCVLIAPEPGGELTWVRASYHSVRGRIACRWRKRDDSLDVAAEIPPNVEAIVELPADSLERVCESGRPCLDAPGVAAAEVDGDRVRLRIGSGRYEFAVRGAV